MRWIWVAVVAMACAKAGSPLGAADGALDAVLVPGCPSLDDGALSGCQWQRAIWAAQLWEDGATTSFITSGNAVQNRYIEAEALKAGMVALGVPASVVYTETQALHSDENGGYALVMAHDLGFDEIGVASHTGHASGIRAMLKAWGAKTMALGMDNKRVTQRMREGLPPVRTEPVPDDEWLPLADRERLIADRLGTRRRASSLWVYTWGTIAGRFKRDPKPPSPPVSEPSLRGERHRVDTRPWAAGSDQAL